MQQNQSAMPSRRTVVRSAAWTAPAVAMAVAAPAYATSGQSATTPAALSVTRSGNEIWCTSPFTAGSDACNSLQALVTVTLTGGNAVLDTPLAAQGWTGPVVDGSSYAFTTAAVAAGATQNLALRIPIKTGNLDQVTVTIHYTWAGNTTGVTTSGTYTK